MIPATAFYLLRHGESEANVLGVAAGGGVDSPLTVKGEAQAKELGDIINTLTLKPSVIFVSPMQRARRTAEIVNTHLKLSIRIVEDLREHELGEWEGQDWPTVKPFLLSDVKPKGGESRMEFACRVKTVLDMLLAEKYPAPPLIVAHGGTFHSIARLYGREIDRISNCHLHRFEPYLDHAAFPFQMWEYNIAGTGLDECRSPHCPLFEQRKLG